jgi:hypothetical protein
VIGELLNAEKIRIERLTAVVHFYCNIRVIFCNPCSDLICLCSGRIAARHNGEQLTRIINEVIKQLCGRTHQGARNGDNAISAHDSDPVAFSDLAGVTSPVATASAAADMARAFDSADASGSYDTNDASASGIEQLGTTRTSFVVNASICSATGMMFLLFGKITT